MKITKKIAAVVVTGALALAMPAAAFAADSTLEANSPGETQNIVKEKNATVNVAGGYNVAFHQVYNLVAGNAQGQDVLATWQITGDLVNGEKATITTSGLEKNTTYTWYVQHEKSYQTIQFTTDDNGVGTVTTTEFSLWSLVKGAKGNSTTARTDAGTSPQTGMDLTAPVAGTVVALVAAAGATYAIRRKITA